ncbi:hypothetical protein BH11VER1_BH11VER1_26910 [soil metagenome]
MKFSVNSFLSANLALLTLSLSSCVSWDKIPKIPLPKLPEMHVPFVSKAAPEDPLLPFTLKQPLGSGHTLQFSAYAGQISPDKLFNGSVMVDQTGEVDLGKYGQVRVGGLSAYEALLAIQGAFHKKRGESIINVQLTQIEDVPLLTVRGAVTRSGIYPYFEGATIGSVLGYAGGRDVRATGDTVYVTHKGVRAYHPNSDHSSIPLEPGDIITLSDGL